MINKKDIRKTKKLYLEWTDSSTIRGWRDMDIPQDLAPSRIVSTGYLIRETDAYLTISNSVSINGNALDPLSIPKSVITKRRTLK